MTLTRSSLGALQESLIRKLANQAMGQAGVIPLWFGEPDRPTPDFIRDVAKSSLDAGNTFYQPNAGIPALRQAIGDYMNALYGSRFSEENIVVTGSGMAAVMLAGQCLVSPGDVLVTHAPTWPNLPSAQQVLGAEVRRVPLEAEAGGWKLDLDRLFEACENGAKALLINSPSNPTGWMLSDEEQQAILDFCRERGLWLISDEVYNRIVYDRPYAPTFADKIVEEDRVLIVNSFSKSWAMTGWRLGWLTVPKRLTSTFEMLTEYSTSCVLGATQVAGIAAVEHGEAFIRASMARYQASLELLRARFAELPRVFFPLPRAAFYAFFAVDGVDDSFRFASETLARTQVGLAPGAAFGPEGEGFLRLCFAVEPDLLDEALGRLEPVLS
jgi:aspartate/methionine/tyrosine aminotransferase